MNTDLTAGKDAVELTGNAMVIDALALGYVLDEPYSERCLAGGVDAANVTFVTDSDWEGARRALDTALEKIEASPLLALALTAGDIGQAKKAGRFGVILGTQGAAFLGEDMTRVEEVWKLGMRTIGLAYTAANLLADGCGEVRDGGLTFLGQDFVDAVNGLPMLLDVSHAGHRARAEVAARADHPICTHSNAYAVHANDRNTKDETASAIVAKGGVIGICGLPKSVAEVDPTIEHMLDHCEHYANLLGAAHVGLGLDFTEAYQEAGTVLEASKVWRVRRPDIFGTLDEFLTQSYPRGLHSIRLVANFTQGLLDRGHGEDAVRGILGGNWLRLFGEVVG